MTTVANVAVTQYYNCPNHGAVPLTVYGNYIYSVRFAKNSIWHQTQATGKQKQTKCIIVLTNKLPCLIRVATLPYEAHAKLHNPQQTKFISSGFSIRSTVPYTAYGVY